jgi:hypothetical protein
MPRVGGGKIAAAMSHLDEGVVWSAAAAVLTHGRGGASRKALLRGPQRYKCARE